MCNRSAFNGSARRSVVSCPVGARTHGYRVVSSATCETSGNSEINGDFNGTVVGNKVDGDVNGSAGRSVVSCPGGACSHGHRVVSSATVVSGNSEINGDFNGTVVGNKVDGDVNGSAFETSGTLVPSNDVLSEKSRHGWCYGL